jgi:2-polyprenyl-3-methyl-5-hydroxy-6-metoxy-1,4-benzoquinol methylase
MTAEETFMSEVNRKSHWENVYTGKSETEVSWFQENPAPSLELIASLGLPAGASIIDIGGGASRLVDVLVERDFGEVTVLDVSAAALEAARKRLGDQGGRVTWVAADITSWEPAQAYDVWHDRAAFHFLTEPADQSAYVACLKKAVRPGGYVIIGTFALDGPEKCSGLAVVRHDAASLSAALGGGFELIDTRRHDHITPWGALQRFQFSTFRRR